MMPNMRRYITLLILSAATLLQAQTVKSVRLVEDAAGNDRHAPSYEVTYEMHIPQPRTDYSYTVTPVFHSEGDSIVDAPVTVRGRQNALKLLRAFVLDGMGDTLPPYLKAGADTVLSRTLIISSADHPWVKGSDLTLCMSVIGEGCCKIEERETICGDTFRCPRPFVPLIAEVEDNTGKAGALEMDNPVLQHISKYRPYDSTRILRKEEGALYVHFPLDKWTLLHDFRSNAATLDTIVSITRQIMADSTSNVKLIQIIGLASPEGPVRRNNLLGINRAKALRDYIQAHVKVDSARFELCNGGEAWAELRSQVEELDMEGRDQLLSIIDGEADLDRRERKMKQLNGGRTYMYLKENVLSDQRNSGYIRIYYDYVPDEAAATINRASLLLKEERYEEALKMLRTVESDERSLNALGVALYMTGHKDQAFGCFRRAAEKGNAEAQDNLRQLTE